jgi:hypothetical protein
MLLGDVGELAGGICIGSAAAAAAAGVVVGIGGDEQKHVLDAASERGHFGAERAKA